MLDYEKSLEQAARLHLEYLRLFRQKRDLQRINQLEVHCQLYASVAQFSAAKVVCKENIFARL